VKELVFSRSNEPVLPAQASLAESLPITSGVVLARAKFRFTRERVVRKPPASLGGALSDERRTTLFSSMIVVGI
jgi:hypothetical protein